MVSNSAPPDPQLVAYEQSSRDRYESTLCLLALLRRYKPRDYLDVGCGPGHMVLAADTLGVEASGLDLHVRTREFPNGGELRRWDITAEKWDIWGHNVGNEGWDLVTCLEVAEHIPAEYADRLCKFLGRRVLNDWGHKGALVFSAAASGQGGSGHVNEQPHKYWVERLSTEGGLREIRRESRKLRSIFRSLAPNAWWYAKNVMVFVPR